MHARQHMCLSRSFVSGRILPDNKPRKGVLREAHTRFLTHHVANISTAIQTADAQTILNAASARMLRVSFGVL